MADHGATLEHPGTARRRNPFVGPRSIRFGEPIYGREVELADVCHAVVAQRIVLLYSPSGAGKSSLLEAGVRPELQRRDFLVLPTIRVSYARTEAATRSSANPYVMSTIASLDRHRDHPGRPWDPPFVSLSSYADHWIARADPSVDPCIVFDQFEELFVADPTDQDAKAEFMADLGVLLRDKRWRALISMREDYIAQLDPYLHLVPTRLSARYRLDFLGPAAAREVIQRTALDSDVGFTDAAADILIDDLRSVRVQRGDSIQSELGPSIEPVQLQVVCRQLWGSLDEGTFSIGADDVRALAHVDDALGDYYSEEVQRVAAATGTSERAIRTWFEEQLVTEAGFRNQLHEGPGPHGSDVLRELENGHLIRSEQRRGTLWYELAHDRLVEPIRDVNRAWRESHLATLQLQAQAWERSGRPSELLLGGGLLQDADAWAQSHGGDLLPVDHEYLDASLAEERRRDFEKKRVRQRFFVVAALGLAALLALIVALLLMRRSDAERRAESRTKQVQAYAISAEARIVQEDNPALALVLASEGDQASSDPTILVRDALSAAGSAFSLATWQPIGPAMSNGRPAFGVAFSPDGSQAVSSHDNGAIQLWDPSTGLPIGEPMSGHTCNTTTYTCNVSGAVFSPDGRLIASAGDDGTVRLWNPATSQQVGQALDGHGGQPVVSVAFNREGSLLASAGFDGRIVLWDPATGQQVGEPLLGHDGAVWSVAFNQDGTLLASGGADRTVRLWDPAAGRQVVESIEGHEDAVLTVAFSPDGKLLASGGDRNDRMIRLWNPTTGERVGWPLRNHQLAVTALAFSPDGKVLASGSADRTIRRWSIATREQMGEPLSGHENAIFGLAFGPDGRTLVSASSDGTVQRWDLAPTTDKLEIAVGGGRPVFGVTYSPDGSLLVTSDGSGTVRLWDAATGTMRAELFGHARENVSRAVFSPDGRLIASAGNDGTVRLWDPTTGQQIGEPLEGHGGQEVVSVAFNPDGNLLASAGFDGRIVLWDPATGQQIGEPLEGHDGKVWSVAFSPDGTLLASGGADRTVRLWDPTTGRQVGDSLEGHEGEVLTVAFSPDGKLLASGGNDRTVRLWDPTTGRAVGDPLRGHLELVNGLSFSPDGRLLASASQDLTVRLWDTATGERYGLPLTGHLGYVWSVAFSPDGNHLASSSEDGTVRVVRAVYDPEYVCEQARPYVTADQLREHLPPGVAPTCELPGEATGPG
jgi:WD40 repeat protein